MKISDLLQMSLSSLLKRKLRSVLTILGVVIGIAAIVTMVSLGLGMQKLQLEQIEEYGGLTSITVYPDQSDMVTSTSHVLDDDMIKTFSELEHVEIVSPVLSTSAILLSGKYKYEAYSINGYTLDGLRALNYKFSEGSLPKEGDQLKFIYGNMLLYNFVDAHTGLGYYDNYQLPDIDLMNDTIFTVFDTENFRQTGSSSDAESPKSFDQTTEDPEKGSETKAPVKKLIVPAAGLLYGKDQDDWHDYSNGIYCDIEALKTTLKRIFRNKAIPGQPLRKNGKPYKKWFYSNAYIKVSDIKYVSEVQQKIKEMGFEASSNSDWIQQTQESSRNLAAMLGGIGAVSMLVAAIGIANTMMMSIYERTKEIGVMKVLGCELRDIQTLFLLEAAVIGLVGGIIGNLLSFIVAFTINRINGNQTCYITPWLVLAGLAFAIVVGVLAGYFPSKRAMSLSPLAAIRNE
ncbi:MAG: ABC transporter permease [Lachnospiraceae bacterium]|nr:ABC transporter permease [Lachnospiraceae bacterium]